MASKESTVRQPRSQPKNRDGVKSCLRALNVIDYFTQTGQPARTFEISEALGIPNSSADEILRTLAANGYLSYNRLTKQYAPSYKLIAAARGIEKAFFGGDHVHELLNDIRAETGATVYLTLQNDCWVESVAEIRGHWTKRKEDVDYPTEVIHFDSNRWCPGTNFAAAMLAQQSNAQVMELATRTQRLGLGPQGPSLMKYLVDRVARTRAKGYAVARRGHHSVVDSLAVPLRLPRSVAPYAVGIVGDTLFETENDIKTMASVLRGVILRHSESLRHVSAASLNIQ